MSYIKKIFFLTGYNNKKILIIVLFYFFLSLFDVLGIALIGSFTSLLLTPEYFLNLFDKINYFNVINNNNILILVGALSVIIFFLKTIFTLFLYQYIIKFSFYVQANTRELLMNSYALMDYETFVKTESSKHIQMSGNMVKTFGSVLNSFLQSAGDLVIFFSISFFLLLVNYKIFFLLMGISIIFYTVYKIIFLNRLKKVGFELNKNYSRLYKNIKDFFLGFKEIKILSFSSFFINDTTLAAKKIANLDVKNSFTVFAPKYLVELFLVLILIIFFIYSSNIDLDRNFIISTGSFFIVASLRIIPILISFVRLKSTLNLGKNSVAILYDEIFKIKHIIKHRKSNNILSKKKFLSLKFSNVIFSYKNNNKKILSIKKLTIKKGEIVGILGISGSGKTTFIDLITGLLKPTTGQIVLNNKYVNKNFFSIVGFSYISQNPFLMNDSIIKNITISPQESEVDKKALQQAIKKANIEEFINSQKNGIQTCIGEDAIRISGGQKQRIALARAFYQNYDVIILDEPTSALDDETADYIFSSVIKKNNGKTIIIVSHSPTLIKFCKRVFEVKNGVLYEKK